MAKVPQAFDAMNAASGSGVGGAITTTTTNKVPPSKDDIKVRSNFRENWIWQTVELE